MVIAALVGIVATGTQIVEKITISKDTSVGLFCDINSVLSCSNVLDAWQSSVLGPPNSFIGAVLFAVFLGAGATALLGSHHSHRSLLVLLGLITFFAAFATWFMAQTAFVISALCLWCIFITTAILVIGLGTTRILKQRIVERPTVGWQRFVSGITSGGRDVIIWVGWWVVVAVMLFVGLAT